MARNLIRDLIAIIVALGCVACGGASDPPAVSILVSSDGSHPCAGAVELKATLSELNGDSTEYVLAAAVAPEQFDCDFDVGVAEAVYSVMVGEIDVGVIHTVAIELYDSTGLVVGYIKGRLVFRKTAMRYLDRIASLPNPSRVRQLYGVSSYILLALMIGLGISLRRLGVPEEIRGTILVAVGSGLIQGATTIFRAVTRLAGPVTT